MLNRRRMLALGAVAGGAGAAAVLLPKGTTAPVTAGAAPAPVTPTGAGGAAAAGHVGHSVPSGFAVPGGPAIRPAVTPFTVPMPLAKELRPVASTSTADRYELTVKPADVEILPGLKTPMWTYGGSFMGPVIRARTGRATEVSFRNDLALATNVHLHGAHVDAANDGYPMELIEPGGSRTYRYPNKQQGALLWYHAHSHGTDPEHVYRGQHGFYIVDDPAEAGLNLPCGAFDVPIMLRDALFDAAGNFVFGGNPADRNVALVNGKPQPYFQVAARKYRFRIVNTATERVFRLSLAGAKITQIGTDGGLLPAPVDKAELKFSSGERVDVVIDFSQVKFGSSIVLTDATFGPMLRFDVVRRATDTSKVPARLRPLEVLPAATVTRDVAIATDFSQGGPIPVGVINGKPFDHNRIDMTVKRGSTELWNISNADGAYGFTHNFHIHLVQFQVISRNGGPPAPEDAGLKDTVLLPPGDVVQVKAQFTGYLGKYVYHCHFLEHGAIGMMGQMEIVD
ncbi:multicopper oxidase family protein [Amycolatopsis sp. A133]|uniref:multicopper oxidase family protein n=1 Tax=Amycolatopsis sp. A133 TaxID=3064472 RepID=UPI0027F2AE74|nr:multicopper oxidase family protein [Amycolatopsis sp. A133]MDQ7806759.1 multicopper oxidase family protein [Amycolatopsis sp. A133]